MCSNSSIDNTRSNDSVSGAWNSYVAISPVTIVKLLKPRLLACESMYSFCVRELEKPVIFELGNLSARNRLSDPHPHLLYVSSSTSTLVFLSSQIIPKVEHSHAIFQIGLPDIVFHHQKLCLTKTLSGLEAFIQTA